MQVVATIRAPARSMPCFSDSIPTWNPGSSAREMRGRWKVSQSCISRMALLPAATSVAPPWKRGLLAMIPIG